MVELADRGSCTGCAACATVCAKGAIRMLPDDEGFIMPQIDSAVCVGCGRCAKVCPPLHQREPRTPLSVYVARAKDLELRMSSSSGGVFSLLAKNILEEGGVVYGAALDAKDLIVRHQAVENESDLAKLRGAKYVQSETAGTYAMVGSQLREGRSVLYSGTPCQIAGLFAYLSLLPDIDSSRLLTVEVICNSVPSPRIFAMWRDRQVGDAGGALLDVKFRDKELGWRHSTFKFTTTTTTTKVNLYKSDYYILWQHGYTVRRSCQTCLFRGLRSGADVTIGDAWGVETMGAAAALDDGKGVSIALANTTRGSAALTAIAGSLDRCEIDYQTAVWTNPALERTANYLLEAGEKRDAFWRALRKSGDVYKVGHAFTRPPLKMRIRHLGGRVLRKLGIRK